MAKALQGVMAALLTPFDHQQQLDSESLRRLVRLTSGRVSTGCTLAVPPGKHSYRALLKREQVLEIVAEEAKEKSR